MSDPLDRLGDAFEAVTPPDRWPEIEARAAGDVVSRQPGRGRRATAAWWMAAAACLAALIAGIAAVTTDDSETPAVAPNETLPEPAPATVAVTDPPVASSVPAEVTVAPSSTVPPLAPTGPTMPCRSVADAAAVQALLRAGYVAPEYEPAADAATLLERVDVVVRAELVAAERSGSNTTTLHIAVFEQLAGTDADLTSIDIETGEPPSPDPLASAVTFDGVELLIFARRDTVGAWRPDPQGLLMACSGGPWQATPILEAADFLGAVPITTIVGQVVRSLPGHVAPWGRECVDQTGGTPAPVADPVADRPFGPLQPEPGLSILYPNTFESNGFDAPTSTVVRVPGGTFVRLQTSGLDGASSLIAVIDDNGSIRWRRCLPDTLSSHQIAVAGATAYIELTPATTGAAPQWWSFDLGSGESVLADERHEAAPARPDRGDVGFDAGDQRQLRRVVDGVEVWRRADLSTIGGEGFEASAPEQTAVGEVVLVRACVDRASPTADCIPDLLGIDPADGRTIWQIHGGYDVPLVADGLAIVVGADSVASLIDLATGEVVAGAVSGEPGAFVEECCAGFEYARVERAGAIAWTIDYTQLSVWFPAGSPGPGVAIDVLGPAGEVGVTARWGASAAGRAGCTASCRFVDAFGRGFTPGATVEAECWGDHAGAWERFAGPYPLPVHPDGSVVLSGACYYGFAGAHAKVVIDGVESGAITN